MYAICATSWGLANAWWIGMTGNDLALKITKKVLENVKKKDRYRSTRAITDLGKIMQGMLCGDCRMRMMWMNRNIS